jgi:hypothetical protein
VVSSTLSPQLDDLRLVRIEDIQHLPASSSDGSLMRSFDTMVERGGRDC